jgi:hypothetical protein
MQINSGEYKQIVIFDHVTRRKLWKQFQPFPTIGMYSSSKLLLLSYNIIPERWAWVMRFSQLATRNVKKELVKYENVRKQYIWYNGGALVQLCAAVLLKERRIQKHNHHLSIWGQLSICMGTSEVVTDEYPMIQSFSAFGWILCWQLYLFWHKYIRQRWLIIAFNNVHLKYLI